MSESAWAADFWAMSVPNLQRVGMSLYRARYAETNDRDREETDQQTRVYEGVCRARGLADLAADCAERAHGEWKVKQYQDRNLNDLDALLARQRQEKRERRNDSQPCKDGPHGATQV